MSTFVRGARRAVSNAPALEPDRGVRVLVATAATQGADRDDLFDCLPGELLWVPTPGGTPNRMCVQHFRGRLDERPHDDGADRAVRRSAPVGPADARRRHVHTHCYPGARADVEAERLLRTAARFPIGAVIERCDGGHAHSLRRH